jgi:hypothetical protein
MSNEQPMPHDVVAEAGALACVVSADQATAVDCLAKLTLEDFYDQRHRYIFRALCSIDADSKPLEMVVLAQWLRDKHQIDEVGGHEYFHRLPDATPSPINFPFFLDALRDVRSRRAVLHDAATLQELSRDTTISRATLEEAIGKFAGAYATSKKCPLTIRKPSEFIGMTFSSHDNILGDRLLASGQPLVIAAAGGTGKSRLLLQAAASVVSGRKFLALDTGGKEFRWLILQTENSNRRLQEDLMRIQRWLGPDWNEFENRVLIHSLETDSDSFVSLENAENVQNIAAAIERSKPDIIAIDPLNDFAIGDLNKDVDMRATVVELARVCRRGNPNRAIVVLHHALTGRGGAAKATGYDRASFARNSKVLHSWTRGQINLVAVDGDNNERLVVACGKCFNGREFPTFAVRLNPSTMIYECDPSVDITQWQKNVSGHADREPLMTPERVKELCKAGSTQPDLAKAIMDDCGCARPSAYRYIKRAVSRRSISLNKANGTYSPK